MPEKSNKERLATIEEATKNIDKNIDLMVKNNKEQWQAINKNTTNIASIKGAALAISGCVSFFVTLIGLAWSMLMAKVT